MFADPGNHGVCRHGTGQEIALHEIGTAVRQISPGRCVLDAFGDHFEPELVAEIDNQVDDKLIGRGFGEPEHKRLVDLELVRRQAFELGK